MTVPPSRRQVLSQVGRALVSGALVAGCTSAEGASAAEQGAEGGSAPMPADPEVSRDETHRERAIASTWGFGQAANAVAWETLLAGSAHPLDACELGVHVSEADPSIHSVGFGGNPNALGMVQLDAAIMRGDTLDCGSVAALEEILHPISVARLVMVRTRHVLLVGAGAKQFALEQGFDTQDLLTDRAHKAWLKWQESNAARPPFEDDHDTIGMIVKDGQRFAMAVTTSGAAYKLPGRVGDSPIVGAGGYCDDDAGACVATGMGEEVIRHCGSFAVVDAMRRGAHPADAAAEVLARVQRKMKAGGRSHFIGMVAMDRHGRVGGASVNANFPYALTDETGTTLVQVTS
ncbi:MAG: N4-(beta-N-acetylglucosaminyl)-L-asparaginase [Pseudohongiellaceae bacterium]|jgi:N4-(beta-N-acetylglucosaminyl)-L-asparaginase